MKMPVILNFLCIPAHLKDTEYNMVTSVIVADDADLKVFWGQTLFFFLKPLSVSCL